MTQSGRHPVSGPPTRASEDVLLSWVNVGAAVLITVIAAALAVMCILEIRLHGSDWFVAAFGLSVAIVSPWIWATSTYIRASRVLVEHGASPTVLTVVRYHGASMLGSAYVAIIMVLLALRHYH